MQTIHLDVSNMGIVPTIYAKQGDVGRKFKAILTDGGATYPIPAGAAVSVWYNGASGEGNYTDIGDESAVVVSGNEITVELIAQMLKSHGGGFLCVVINSSGGDQLGTWNIPYSVEQVPGSDSEKAIDYYSAFSKAVENLPYPDESLSVPGKAADAAAVGKALSEKAPAGYGSGGNAKSITNPDDATIGGVYWIYDKTDNMPFNFMILLSMPYYNDLVQIGTQWTSGVMATRHHTSSTGWSEWGYITPPMVAGTEYRTTERWNGKVVYTKLIHCGTMPNNANVNIQGLTPNMNLIDFDVVFVSPYLSIKLPHFDNSGKMTARAICNTNSSVIQILTTTDMSQYTGYATIKYTKD